MGVRKPRYFLLAYYDDDAKTFNVTGPVTTDRIAGERTIELQKSGRKVRISTTTPEIDVKKVPSPESCIHSGPSGYRYDPDLSW